MTQGFAVKLSDILYAVLLNMFCAILFLRFLRFSRVYTKTKCFILSQVKSLSFLICLATVTLPFHARCFKGATVRKQRHLELRRARPVRS